ncbi:NADH-cytochrome b5 reductase [Chytridiales sp. JEL 0842]|nr:NADH-cytochrome b5 reductase [Chytridiales sp. JEL 0842]
MLTATLTQQASSRVKQIIVVGGGLAGLSAAIEASRKGSFVTLLEKEPRIGGNSAKASSGMNAVPTKAQAARGVEGDSVEHFRGDTIRSGKGRSDDQLVQRLTAESAEALEWIESFGLKLDSVTQCGGHSFPRTHRESPRSDGKIASVGWDIIKTLNAHIQTLAPEPKVPLPQPFKVKVITGARVESLIGNVEDGISGVRYAVGEEINELHSDAVILATGGYANDRTSTSLLKQYAPHLADMPTTNGPWATGDGVKIGTQIGAHLVDMDQVQIHPTGFVNMNDPENLVKFLAPESLRAYGALLIDPKTSSRFIDELATRAVVSEAIMSLKPANEGAHPVSLLIMNDYIVKNFDAAAMGFYASKGLVRKYDNLKAVAEDLQMDYNKLEETVNAYNTAFETKIDKFGKKVFPTKFSVEEPLHVAHITPVLHYSMGGLKITKNAEILSNKTDDKGNLKPIPGLFGAGEVCMVETGLQEILYWSVLSSEELLGVKYEHHLVQLQKSTPLFGSANMASSLVPLTV